VSDLEPGSAPLTWAGFPRWQTIKRLIVIEVGPQPWWTGTVSVIPAATAALIGCSRHVMFRNRANSAGTVAKRAALPNGR
jgi:hypothetical protein